RRQAPSGRFGGSPVSSVLVGSVPSTPRGVLERRPRRSGGPDHSALAARPRTRTSRPNSKRSSTSPAVRYGRTANVFGKRSGGSERKYSPTISTTRSGGRSSPVGDASPRVSSNTNAPT